MKAKTQVRLSLYERGIVEALTVDYGYMQADARALVVEYIEVVRKLGSYDNCEQYAMLLDQARRMKHAPSQWLEHIQSLEKGELRDRGIASEERQYLQTK
ncbi:hypothetical protein BK133_28495 [Paenibacillus sp. FSL H8-0548]|uniref:hypothetical protein n=1 Tax=Paenibacillus sp. FSL H8-0548 TaxID=1920422 RepID=UPI00096CF8BE|nr:hypothetical protein [Paenibacillus sp. FSL H8-0548]OMF21324.1 hypothetical protein BK133_28495 [Paenibacillus sp. FSL H8-0548]